MTSHAEPFDILGDLPSGTTMLQASAGTGKTHAIAAIATRYIAEGHATIDQLLMITFGRSATRELRERVRGALLTARDAVREAQNKAPLADTFLQGLLSRPEADLVQVHGRLARALADFDSATIATTHQFCLHSLAGLGIAADTDPGETFVEDVSDVVAEVVDDLYVRRYSGAPPGEPRLSLRDALNIASQAVQDPLANLAAGGLGDRSEHQTRFRLAQAVRSEVLARRRSRRLVTFDDLVLRLRDSLLDPVTGAAACERLRAKYRVVLVDEFQDTDPAQWAILRTAFHGHRALVLIGDPKQAIYAFRGADVYSYLEASDVADHHATLPVNHRSDAQVVAGLAQLMSGLELGDSRIIVQPVVAANREPRLVEIPGSSRVRLRSWFSAELPKVAGVREIIARDVASELVSLMTGPARLVEPGFAQRKVLPGDIAVLVSTHEQARLIGQALETSAVPFVLGTAGPVFASSAAEQWLILLSAMEKPSTQALRALALTDFIGISVTEIATDGDRIDLEVGDAVRYWASVLQNTDVASLFATISAQVNLEARVLAHRHGERDLTDVRHVASTLHAQQRKHRLGLVGLIEWLSERITRAQEKGRDTAPEMSRRLESDAQAVQVLTVHASKGLEFPIAFVPFGWDRFHRKEPSELRYHDASGRRVLDVRGPGSTGWDEARLLERSESDGESLRSLYVALTRARSHLVVHWASSDSNTNTSPLHRILNARASGLSVPARSYPIGSPPTTHLKESDAISLESVLDEPPILVWRPPTEALPAMAAAEYTRVVDQTWRRTSYSGLTAGIHAAERAPATFREDEPVDPSSPSAVGSLEPTPPEIVSPFADLPAGAAFGTLVHGVYEIVDPTASDLHGEVRASCAHALSRHPIPSLTTEQLTQAILPTLSTPLGPDLGEVTLSQIRPCDRLAELDFEFPMGSIHHSATLGSLAEMLRNQMGDDDPLREYPDHLETPDLGPATLRGFLSGSIDAVLRLPVQNGCQFVVVDYKTNLLRDPARPGLERLAWGYRPEALGPAMISAHYPLQALLYSAALHRYLRWRQPGYDPHLHLGGVRYLFLRGMAGGQTPKQSGVACGVFAWRPSPQLVVALSDLLDGAKS